MEKKTRAHRIFMNYGPIKKCTRIFILLKMDPKVYTKFLFFTYDGHKKVLQDLYFEKGAESFHEV